MANKKYQPNKKNNGNVPQCKDQRAQIVPVGCGYCMECLKQKARWWQVRLTEEIRHDNTGKFVTLTFNDTEYKKLADTNQIDFGNYVQVKYVGRKAVRRFTDTWRKEHKTAVKHWLITELGQTETERLHLHGIIFTDKPKEIQRIWKYGFTYIGDYVSDRTTNYITKYLTKTDQLHKDFVPKIYTSPGIGADYLKRPDAKRNTFKGIDTDTLYRTRDNQKLDLPVYYRNKLYTEEEREKLWIQQMDKQERWVDGLKIDVSQGYEQYWERLKISRAKNKRLGYKEQTDWNQSTYQEALTKYNNGKISNKCPRRTGSKSKGSG